MSGIVKHVKKTFKRHLKTVKKWGKWVALAVAVYFTAGLALSAMPATASFAAAMPGFAGGGFAGLGIGAGATAGTGIFTQAAAAMGLGTFGSAGGLVGGALAAGTSASALGATLGAGALATGAAEATAAGLISGGAAAGGSAGLAGTVGLGGATGGAIGEAATGLGIGSAGAAGAGIEGTVGLAAAGGGSGIAGTVGLGAGAGVGAGVVGISSALDGAVAKAGMSLTDKLLLASVGTQTIGTLLGPSPAELAREQAKADKTFYGAFYGMEADGSGGGAVVPKPAAMSVAAPKIQAPAAGGAAARTAGTQATKDLFPNALQVNQDQEGDQNLFAPMQGVRYV